MLYLSKKKKKSFVLVISLSYAEKINVLQLRTALPKNFHLDINEIEFQETIGSGEYGTGNNRLVH